MADCPFPPFDDRVVSVGRGEYESSVGRPSTGCDTIVTMDTPNIAPLEMECQLQTEQARSSTGVKNLRSRKVVYLFSALCCCSLLVSILSIVLLSVLSPWQKQYDTIITRDELLKQQDENFRLMREFLLGGETNNSSSFSSSATATTLDMFMRPNSPQKQALEWMAYIDITDLHIPATGDDMDIDSTSRFLQRYALLVLYYSNHGNKWEFARESDSSQTVRPKMLAPEVGESAYEADLDTSIRGWSRPSGIGVHECDWQLVTCDKRQLVTELNFGEHGVVMTGELPAEIELLSNLVNLDLSKNRLEGPLRPEIFKLTNLELLDLSDNEFTSSISKEIGRLSNLKMLSLRVNLLTGFLPDTIQDLLRLEELHLDGNKYLSGRLFQDFPVNFLNIQIIDISMTQISGTIPKEIWRLSNLKSFHAYEASLAGTLPTEIGALSSLEEIKIYENRGLGGLLPTEIGSLTNLLVFHVENNSFTGTIPTEIGKLTKLETFNANYNRNIYGTIPTEIGCLKNVKDFQVQTTRISGTFPTELSLLTNLEILSTRYASMVGTVPEELCNRSKFPFLEAFRTDCRDNFPVVCPCCTDCA